VFPTTFEKKNQKKLRNYLVNSNFFRTFASRNKKTIKTMISIGQIIALAVCVGALVALPKVITHFGQKNNDKVETAE
jgi:hypothetical protein